MTTGLICLQGGREFTPDCSEMDAEVLSRSGAGGANRPVVVLAGAARVGSDYDGAVARATAHYRRLGATVVGVPDPRADLAGALGALHAEVGLVVLPGGSPTALIDVLLGSTPEIGERLIELAENGTAISGASAGAMALCEYCVLPERQKRRQLAVTYGLALAEGVALPHWTLGDDRWPLPDDVHLWGLPECGGVLIDGHALEGVGAGEAAFRHAGTDWRSVIRAR